MDIFDAIHSEAQQMRAARKGHPEIPQGTLPRNMPNPGAAPAGVQKAIDKHSAEVFYKMSGNDPEKARAKAILFGWKIE